MSRSMQMPPPTAGPREPASGLSKPAAGTAPGGVPRLIALQQAIGNRALGRLLREGTRTAAPPDRRRSLPAALRAKMEAALGGDFTTVRFYEGEQPKSFGARAYTAGRDVHVATGLFEPDTRRGQELLGHELWHVVQQSQGRVAARTRHNGVALNGDRALEAEASIRGARAATGVRGDAPLRDQAAVPAGSSAGVVQLAGFSLTDLVNPEAAAWFGRSVVNITGDFNRGHIDAPAAHRQLNALIDRFTADWKNGELPEPQIKQFAQALGRVVEAMPRGPKTEGDTAGVDARTLAAADVAAHSERVRAAVSGPNAADSLAEFAKKFPFTAAHVDALGGATASIALPAPIPLAGVMTAYDEFTPPSATVGTVKMFRAALDKAKFPAGQVRDAIDHLLGQSGSGLGAGAGVRLRTVIVDVVIEGARAGLDVANGAVRNFLLRIATDQASDAPSDTGSQSNTRTFYTGELDMERFQPPESRSQRRGT